MTVLNEVISDVPRFEDAGVEALRTTVLHISNTDIRSDSRIRKELHALGKLPSVEIHVVGVPEDAGSESAAMDGANYIRLRLSARVLSFLPRAARYFLEMIEFTAKSVRAGRRLRPAVVHCHDTFALPAGWLLKKSTGCRLVYDAHELESDKNGQNAMLANATLLIERTCWRGIDLLISVSGSIVDWYSENLGNKPSVLILNSPMIDESCAFAGQQENYFRKKYGIPEDHLVFVYLGILGPGRGIEACLEAFVNGPREAHVVFMGFGVLKEEILRLATDCPTIHFHEAVAHDRVVPLVRTADYGLCMVENASLSDYYCLPNKLFEYCFAGLPVLASNLPEITKLVDQYSLGLCCDPAPDKVQAALRLLVSLPRGRVTADLSALSWQAQANRLGYAYQELLYRAVPSSGSCADHQH